MLTNAFLLTRSPLFYSFCKAGAKQQAVSRAPDAPEGCVLRGKDLINPRQLHPAHGVWKSCNHQREEFTHGPSYHREVEASSDTLPSSFLSSFLSSPMCWYPACVLRRGWLSWHCTWKSKQRLGPHHDANCPSSEWESMLQLNSISWALLSGHQKDLRQKKKINFLLLLLHLKWDCNIPKCM